VRRLIAARVEAVRCYRSRLTAARPVAAPLEEWGDLDGQGLGAWRRGSCAAAFS